MDHPEDEDTDEDVDMAAVVAVVVGVVIHDLGEMTVVETRTRQTSSQAGYDHFFYCYVLFSVFDQRDIPVKACADRNPLWIGPNC